MLEPIRPKPIMPSCMAASRLKHEDVNGDGQTNHRQDSGNNQRRPDMQGRITDAPLQIADIKAMANSGQHANEYPDANHAEPERCRNALAGVRRQAARKLVLADPE